MCVYIYIYIYKSRQAGFLASLRYQTHSSCEHLCGSSISGKPSERRSLTQTHLTGLKPY